MQTIQRDETLTEPAPLLQSPLIRLGAKRRLMGLSLGCIASLLNAFRWTREGLFPSPPTRSVLLMEPFGMGDLISHEPLIRLLRKNDYEVNVCARAAWRPLFASGTVSRWVDTRIPWVSYDDSLKYSLGALCSAELRHCLRELRQIGRGAIGIDTRGDIRSILLLHLAGCRQVVSLSHYLGYDFRNLRSGATLVPYANDLKRWELNLKFLESLGIPPGRNVTPPVFPHLLQAKVNARPRHIGLVPVAPWAGKFWPAERWAALIGKLQTGQWQVIGLCGPNQMAATRTQLGTKLEIRECPTVEEWADVFTSLGAIVTVDTGPMHLAAALGVPVVALFGAGKLPLWSPSGSHCRVVHHQDDADFQPCHPIIANVSQGSRFMERITVTEVLAALEELRAN